MAGFSLVLVRSFLILGWLSIYCSFVLLCDWFLMDSSFFFPGCGSSDWSLVVFFSGCFLFAQYSAVPDWFLAGSIHRFLVDS